MTDTKNKHTSLLNQYIHRSAQNLKLRYYLSPGVQMALKVMY